MKAIMMSPMVTGRKITLSRVTDVIVTHRLPVSISGTLAAIAGAVGGSDPLMYAGAFAALLAVYLTGKKGGGDDSVS